MAKEHTPSRGLLCLEHTRELQQTVWSLNNRLFCIGWFEKAKDSFFFVYDTYARKNSSWRMKTPQGSLCNLRWAAAPRGRDAIFSLATSVRKGHALCPFHGGWVEVRRSPIIGEGPAGPQWEPQIQ